MEVFITRISHIAENIFEQLDNNSLKNCREVTKLWQKYIDSKDLSWIRIINIPKILINKDTYLHTAAKTGQSEIFETIIREEENKNPKNKNRNL